MNERVPKALRGESVDRTPVWFMRQAGRYLPEYRAIREEVSFLELCHDPDLACEVTAQPIDRFDLDAAIVFSDILVVLDAIGRPVEFIKGQGPKVVEPVRSVADVDSLSRPDVTEVEPLRSAPATIGRFREERPEVPILGFAGAPFTLLCYLVEGGGSKNWLHVKRLLFQEPEAARRALDLIADVVGDYLQVQIEAGAAAVQMFDTWAGILSPADYLAFALPAAQRAFGRVSGAPRIYFTKDSAAFLEWLPETGADAVGLDWRVEIGEARRRLGTIPVQGNLDPTALFAPPREIRRRVRAILDQAGEQGHVFNLGHGVLPGTPIEGVETMIDEVRRFRV